LEEVADLQKDRVDELAANIEDEEERARAGLASVLLAASTRPADVKGRGSTPQPQTSEGTEQKGGLARTASTPMLASEKLCRGLGGRGPVPVVAPPALLGTSITTVRVAVERSAISVSALGHVPRHFMGPEGAVRWQSFTLGQRDGRASAGRCTSQGSTNEAVFPKEGRAALPSDGDRRWPTSSSQGSRGAHYTGAAPVTEVTDRQHGDVERQEQGFRAGTHQDLDTDRHVDRIAANVVGMGLGWLFWLAAEYHAPYHAMPYHTTIPYCATKPFEHKTTPKGP
jgi:hypothetical protein